MLRIVSIFSPAVLGIKPSAWSMLVKCPTSELHPSPIFKWLRSIYIILSNLFLGPQNLILSSSLRKQFDDPEIPNRAQLALDAVLQALGWILCS